ncbi:MAG: TadE/TadG family protein [Defluviimonas sp.]|uniref:pilus assembly protein TadG-related protein n=1 Tax=Albidovulum sp. TaxID=1872424 RepID=UPI001E14528B|nr:TadE/TadG family protein [Paracoccaceae bacterium]MCC0063604.1 TadE/TadG family protein [Defluviimonas sp.]
MRSATAAIERFRREERGSLVIFGLFIFCSMLVLAGVAVDLMRFEERRTLLQNTVDRASLAAASLQQTLPPKQVVIDYFTKAGLTPPSEDDITVVDGPNNTSRSVTVNVSETMPTWFMKIAGVETLGAPARSTAEESVGQLEISLVLDVSGSMAGSRINKLKPAAKNFVDKIFDSSEPGKVSISIIPYATQVALPDNMMSYLNVTQEHTFSNCIEFSQAAGDFDTPALSFGTGPFSRVYKRNGHFDPWGYSPYYDDASPPESYRNCPTASARKIMPFSEDRNALKNYIEGLEAYGNTSIDIGVKWGAALLDPSLKPMVHSMAGAGQLSNNMDGRPFTYGNGETLKILVVMTDGENTTEYRLQPDVDHGQSLLVRNKWYRENNSSSDDTSVYQYSLWDAQRGKYWVFAKRQWRSTPWGNQSGDSGYSGSPQAVPMSWPEVWDTMSIRYFSDVLVANVSGNNWRSSDWRPGSNSETTTYISSQKDSRTLDICDAAKSASSRLRIYTIAFEAPRAGERLLNSCQNAGFYAVEGLDINKAFEGIVNSINKLRLTH